jgi:2-methylisocitrate lyase-like PEP mutase family enzyme
MSQREKAEAFRALHEGEPFLIPNPWDAGAARMLEALGFKALATTSSGFAFTLGRLDGAVTLDEVADHVRVMCAATALPVAVDLENGYGAAPEAAALAITRAAEAGAVGGSIEDYDREDDALYPLEAAAERVAAAVEAARALDFPFTLTARAENHLHGVTDIEDTIARLQAYEAAGADVLFAPGLRSADQIRAICSAVSKPVNVLGHAGLSFADIVAAGGQRVSVGGALTWVGVAAAAEAAERLRDGDLSVLTARPPLTDWLS